MDTAARMYYFARLAALLVAVLITLVATVVQLRRRSPSAKGRIATSVLTLIVVAATVVMDIVRPSVLWITALAIAGVALGLLAGKTARPYEHDGRVVVKRSAIPPLVGALAFVLTSITLLFGTTYLLAFSLLLLVFWAGLSAGSAVVESRSAQAFTPAPPARPLAGPMPSA